MRRWLLLLPLFLLLGCADGEEQRFFNKQRVETESQQVFFTVTAVSGSEGDTITFTATLNKASSVAVSANWTTSSGSATQGTDFTAASGTITFAPGATTTQFSVSTIEDVFAEPDEVFKVTFSGGANYNTSSSTKVIGGIIQDDDTLPAVIAADASATEGSAITFTVTLTDVSTAAVTVDYAVSDGTATTADSDYTAIAPGTLTFNAGETSKTVTVNTTSDTNYETNETVTLTLSGGSGYEPVGSDLSATGTITNDDNVPTVAIADDSENEGTAHSYVVTLSNRSYQTVTVDFASSDGTATTADSDYTANSGTLTFVPGDISESIALSTTADTKYEANETVNITLSGGANYNPTGSDLAGVGTIVNDEPLPVISIGNASASEGSNVVFTVTQDRLSAFATTFDYASAGGTAASGTDFTATSGSGSVAAGALTTTVSVPALEDNFDESDETFTVAISNPANGTIGTTPGTGTVVDTVLLYNFLSDALPGTTTFSRASAGMYVDVSGNLVSAANDTPRFDHDPANCPGGVCVSRGLLMEPASTNIVIRSAELENASWVKGNLRAFAADNGDSATPDGVNSNGELVRENGAINTHQLTQSIGTAVATGTLVHCTLYAKPYAAAPRNHLRLMVSDTTGTDFIRADFDLTGANAPVTGMQGTGGGQIAATMEDAGNGWKRLRLSGVASILFTALQVRLNLQDSFQGATTYDGDNSSGIQVWGVQLEAGTSAPTSYVATGGATASRSADFLSVNTFTGFSGNFGDGTNWTMITDFSRPFYESTTTATPRIAEFCDSAACTNERISSRYVATATTFGTESIVGGVSQGASSSGAIVVGAYTVYQLGVVKAAGVLTGYMNGVAHTATGAISYPVVNTLSLGGSLYAGSMLYGHLRKFTLRARSVPGANMLVLTND